VLVYSSVLKFKVEASVRLWSLHHLVSWFTVCSGVPKDGKATHHYLIGIYFPIFLAYVIYIAFFLHYIYLILYLLYPIYRYYRYYIIYILFNIYIICSNVHHDIQKKIKNTKNLCKMGLFFPRCAGSSSGGWVHWVLRQWTSLAETMSWCGWL
jgi:hypothetical protein